MYPSTDSLCPIPSQSHPFQRPSAVYSKRNSCNFGNFVRPLAWLAFAQALTNYTSVCFFSPIEIIHISILYARENMSTTVFICFSNVPDHWSMTFFYDFVSQTKPPAWNSQIKLNIYVEAVLYMFEWQHQLFGYYTAHTVFPCVKSNQELSVIGWVAEVEHCSF